ncbi:MAG: hypothetical protein K6G07_08285 [Lachnospiraceae bacterium]|nr:hypothetical protein [Lachnospiraceae bacterium]
MKNKSVYITYILLVVSLALTAYGIVSGDLVDVFHKAAVICTECIGIG